MLRLPKRVARVQLRPQSLRYYSNEAADFANRKQRIADDINEHKKTWYPLLQQVQEEKDHVVRLKDFKEKFHHVTLENPHPSHVTVRGRVTKLRRASKGLVFMDLVQDGIKVQTVVKKHAMDPELSKQEFQEKIEAFRPGDVVSVTGKPGRTPAGELSLIAVRPAELLTPCLHPLPSNQSGDVHKRLANRVVDFSTSPESREMIYARATVIAYVRRFFSDRGFLEVETPILSDVAGGASARPFTTESNHLTRTKKKSKSDCKEITTQIALRVAPELWLKRLVISGFDKVFEVGPSFRNESIDSTHNPEFTTCEFYWGYAELKDLTDTLEEFFIGLLTTVITKHPSYSERLTPWLEEFKKGIKHVDFLKTIADKSGHELPRDLTDVDGLVSMYKSLGLKLPSVLSPAKLWDELAAEYVEKSGRVLLITNQPELMSPLAKSWTRDGYALSKRFELFIGGMEYANGYEEENSPFAQMDKFVSQQQSRDEHADDEAHVQDSGYVTDMEWGLPPTAGCGIGIDRLVMFITGAKSIQQVIPFAGLKMAR
ncbi:tRNA synthetases class II-domain-containing protein [Yarrowia lipolytica]|nr:tRNA synthetases class II-domain-containing protein [Yarrowia lipolytica]RDW50689.1 tRNA synthetases class II-domain-containing protein [Yarrowia lipolytica]VBB88453.1 Lysyl-tRNA synthetase, putative [Yarrowia lipolytica]